VAVETTVTPGTAVATGVVTAGVSYTSSAVGVPGPDGKEVKTETTVSPGAGVRPLGATPGWVANGAAGVRVGASFVQPPRHIAKAITTRSHPTIDSLRLMLQHLPIDSSLDAFN
jgi:hypothetical protein